MAATMTTLTEIFKDLYVGPIRNVLNNATPLIAELQKDYDHILGKQIVIPIHTARSPAVGSIAEGGTLPTGTNANIEQIITTPKTIYGAILVSGKSMRASRSQAGAFAKSLDLEIRSNTDTLINYWNFLCYRNGIGKLAIWSGADDATPATVYSPHWARTGYVVDLIDATDDDTVLGADLTLGTINPDGTSVGWTGSVSGSAASDYLVMANSLGNEPMGLDGICDDADPPLGDLYGLDRTTVPEFQAKVLGNSGTARALSEDLIQQAFDNVELRGGGNVTHIWTTYGQRRKLFNLLAADKRFPNTLNLKGGFEALSYDGIPVVADKDCLGLGGATSTDKMYVTDLNDIAWYAQEMFGFVDEHGQILDRQSGTADAYVANLLVEGELICVAPNRQATIEDLSR